MAFSDVLPTRKDLQDKLAKERNELRNEAARRLLRWVMGEDPFDAREDDSKVADSSSRASKPRKRVADVVTHNAGNQLELPLKGKKGVSKTARKENSSS